MAIVKRGKKWCVISSDKSKTLGCHGTRAEALKQLQAVEISKHRKEPGATQPRKRRKYK